MDGGAWWAAVRGVTRVGHNWVTSFSLFTFMHWRRKWQPTPVFLPGESQGRGSLVGCLLWGRTESDTTEATQQQQQQKTKSMASGPITSWPIDVETMETVADFILGGSKITVDGNCSHEIKRRLLLGKKVTTNLDSILKKWRYYFVNKDPSSQGYGFSSSHVWMWELGYKESWVQKNWCFWTMVLKKTLESPLDCKEMEPS